ncbi:MAG TPA: class I SAM-dependent methyltransferase [bacterium]|jgi:hypothetical protein|nr:class I SAM-dependent methyltransferase [bacterium]
MFSRPVLCWMNDQLLQFPTVQVELRVDHGLHSLESTPQRFIAGKTRGMVENLVEQLGERWPRHILELGVHKGGSAVLYRELFQPQRLLALDLQPEPVPALAAYAAAHPSLKLAMGVDQSDPVGLAQACAAAFGGAAPDLIIDDASHLLGPTQASFTQLFPRLAPGGLYVIEDWAWAHWPGDAWQKSYEPYFEGRLPMSNLVLKLMLLTASASDLAACVTVNMNQVFIERGPAPLEPGFDLNALLLNRGEGLPQIGKGRP